MPTLVLSPNIDSDSVVLGRAAQAVGWTTERVTGGPLPGHLVGATDLAFHAEPNFGQMIVARLGWELASPPDDWLVSLPMAYRQRSVRATPLSGARRQPGPLFVKPADYRAKVFRAQVYENPALAGAGRELADDLTVVVSEPVVWETEFRVFALDREVATICLSYRYGQPNRAAKGTWPVKIDELIGAMSFARRLLADETVEFPAAVVVDIGRIAGRGWAVVEANPAWCSAIYGCDPSGVLPVVRRACRLAGSKAPVDRHVIMEADRLPTA